MLNKVLFLTEKSVSVSQGIIALFVVGKVAIVNCKFVRILCIILAVTSCSTNDRTTQSTVIDIEESNNLLFREQETGSDALKVAIETSRVSNSEKEKYISQGRDLLDQRIGLSRYIFGSGSPIYVADFKSSLMFDYDKANVRSKDKLAVDDFVELYGNGILGKYIYVVGHTDSDGSANYNYALSARRARAVASLLINNNVPESEVNIIPAGEYLPKASNSSNAGKQLNRRVEIISADSRALMQAYLRQLECPENAMCSRKLLNVLSVRSQANVIEMSLDNKQFIATLSPEVNKLMELDDALRNGSNKLEQRLMETDDKKALLAIGEMRHTFSIPVDIRPTLIIEKNARDFKIPSDYIIQ